MNLSQFLSTVRVYWRTFTAATAVLLGLGLAWLVLSPLQYVSHVQLLVSVGGSATANAYQNDGVVASRVNSYVALLTSDAASQRVVDKLRSPLTAKEMATNITAVQVPNTAIIDIAAAAPSPEQARLIADTVAGEFVGYVASIESPTGEDAQKAQVTVVSSASEPQSRLTERIAIGGLIALIAALFGAAAVWIRAVTDPVIRTPWRAAAIAGSPVLGTVTVGAPDSPAEAEGYRRLRSKLRMWIPTLSPGVGTVLMLVPATPALDVLRVGRNLCGACNVLGEKCLVVDAVSEGTSASPANNVFVLRAWASSAERSLPAAARDLFEKMRGEFDRVFVGTDGMGGLNWDLDELSDSVLLLVEMRHTASRDLTRLARGIAWAPRRLRILVVERVLG